ncbi:MAG: hypothetical protein ABIQ32_11335 [Sphingomicrobium sp.]
MMDLDRLSVTYVLTHEMLPAALVAIAAGAGWFWFCRWYYRTEEREWRVALRRPGGYEAASLDERMSVLIAQRSMAGRGSPADRLFLAGLTVAAVLSLFGLAAYWPR